MSVSNNLKSLVVVLVRPRNPLNIGAAARAMTNFGPSRLRLVNPYSVAFREARSAVGAGEVLKHAEEFKTIAEAVADCALVVGTTAVRNRALQHPLLSLDEIASRKIRDCLTSGRVALLFGSEKIGLTNDDFSHCHWLLNIPTRSENISMNLGQAVAVCLYEMASTELVSEMAGDEMAESSVSDSATPDTKRAPAGVNEQITQTLLEALHNSGYVKPGNDAVAEKKVRRLVLRFSLDSGDATVLLGMARQIAWKLRGEKKA